VRLKRGARCEPEEEEIFLGNRDLHRRASLLVTAHRFGLTSRRRCG
jgi:hypothetical protein